MTKTEFEQQLKKIDTLVRTVESAADSNVRASAVELMRSLMELHGAGIERMLEIAFESGPPGAEIIDRLGEDSLVASLLLLYGLHPVDIETRVLSALDKVRPLLQSQHGDVELLRVTRGVVKLRLLGGCDGTTSSAMKLKLAIEEAIYAAAPDITALEVEGAAGAASMPSVDGLVQIARPSSRSALADRG